MAKGSSRTQDSSLPKDGDTKLFSKLLSKERYNPSKHGDASFRVLYYGAGAAGSVPFLWESQPGTPKHSFNDNPPPPLTPPPYYQSSPQANTNPTLQKKNSKKTLKSMFPKTSSKKINNVSPHSSSSSYSSSFSSSHSLPSTPVHHARINSHLNDKKVIRPGSSAELGVDEDEYEGGSYSPTSTLCLGARCGSASRKMKGYYYPIKSMKKVVLSIVGHGTTKLN